jgi:ATP-dependent protease HslVU (ClpYQ) peptidase subunit
MTTIAIDKFGTIAADGQACIGDARHETGVRKIVVRPALGDRPARIFTMTGMVAMQDALIDWYERGHNPMEVPPVGKDPDWTLVVIEARRQVFLTSELQYPNEFQAPFAFGSGGRHIMGLLVADATARFALEIACKIDVFSGGEIQVVNIAEALGLKPELVRESDGIKPKPRSVVEDYTGTWVMPTKREAAE